MDDEGKEETPGAIREEKAPAEAPLAFGSGERARRTMTRRGEGEVRTARSNSASVSKRTCTTVVHNRGVDDLGLVDK